MKIVKGNLLELADRGEFDVIVHGCNTRGVMGAGIAKAIAQTYPQAYIADKGSMYFPDRLGKITTAKAESYLGEPFIIVNAYTQDNFRGEGRLADYDAIDSAFALIKENFSGRRIGLPKIGAGLARGNWQIISEIIDSHLKDEDVSLVLLDTDEYFQNENATQAPSNNYVHASLTDVLSVIVAEAKRSSQR